MIIKPSKNQNRQKRHTRVRGRVTGTAAIPRLSVFRSNEHIYAQLIDDTTGNTLVSSSTRVKGFGATGTKTEIAGAVGKDLAAKALKKGVKKVVFDRAGYLYTGRVRALADGARSGGLEF